MKTLSSIIGLIAITGLQTFAQTSNGTVSSLVAAENYFSATAKAQGLRDAFVKVSDNETLVFRPNPVKALSFYDKKQEDPGELSWEPSLARISRSGDWGFTTGPYMYTDSSEGSMLHGQYLSIWQANKRGVWKLALDIGSPHPKPTRDAALDFIDPKNPKFFRQISAVRLKQREEMIMATDRLFSSALTKSTALGYDTFFGQNGRMIFPGAEPIIGKANIRKFLDEQEINIFSEPVAANRSLGSDFAYTYGTAQITRKNKTSKYNYVRIWESQEGFKWNVIVELFSPAE